METNEDNNTYDRIKEKISNNSMSIAMQWRPSWEENLISDLMNFLSWSHYKQFCEKIYPQLNTIVHQNTENEKIMKLQKCIFDDNKEEVFGTFLLLDENSYQELLELVSVNNKRNILSFFKNYWKTSHAIKQLFKYDEDRIYRQHQKRMATEEEEKVMFKELWPRIYSHNFWHVYNSPYYRWALSDATEKKMYRKWLGDFLTRINIHYTTIRYLLTALPYNASQAYTLIQFIINNTKADETTLINWLLNLAQEGNFYSIQCKDNNSLRDLAISECYTYKLSEEKMPFRQDNLYKQYLEDTRNSPLNEEIKTYNQYLFTCMREHNPNGEDKKNNRWMELNMKYSEGFDENLDEDLRESYKYLESL